MSDKMIHYIKDYSDRVKCLITKNYSAIVNLYGESGTGKTYLLRNLYSDLNNSGYKCILLKGDIGKKEIDYYPLDEYLEKIYKIKKVSTNVVMNLISEIPVVGKATNEILKEVVDYDQFNEQKDIFNIHTFQIHKEFSLQLLSLINQNKKVVIFCDDIQYFDQKTANYLYDIFRKLQYNFSANISLINSINTSAPNKGISFLNNKETDIHLKLPDKKQIREIIKQWKFQKELSEEMLEVIHISTGGHLYLIQCIVEYLSTGEVMYSSHLIDKKNLLFKIIETRLKDFGDNRDEAREMFCSLSLIGEQASNNEIHCLMGNSNNLCDIINESISLNLLTIKDDYIYFSHEIVKSCFDLFANEFSNAFYLKYSNCIKEISPSHYAKRALLSQKINDYSTADIYYALYALQRFRNGMFGEVANIQDRLISPNKAIITDYLKKLLECYRLVFDGQDSVALLELYVIPDSLPFYLLVEKQYLICLIQFKSNNIENRKEALLQMNEIIASLEKEELEIWTRCMFLKFALEAEICLVNEAKITRTRLINTLSKRIPFDKESAKLLNRICLYSDIIDPPELSHKKLITLVNQLEKEVNNEKYDSILELYIAETNLSGNALILSEYDTAVKSSYKAIWLINEFSLVHFSHREVCYNNLYLALFFFNENEVDQIIDKYKAIFDVRSEEDEILIITNLAGLLVANGKHEEALQLIEKNECNNEVDIYYHYYYQLNYAIILYLNKQQDAALQQLIEIGKYTDQVSSNITKYYNKHYNLLLYILENEDCINLQEIQQKFEEKQSVYLSPIWTKFKKGYLFSDLQIWTEF
ncbi:ATP-binding protein [Dysgonomonas sp. GY75]|uniref:ATP-binding protein n=1 Tax=Dysgonomonas sp. GY75 TaxID=2780419 RepID=UPI0018841733|nr:ATP-binding protein [Dysgonomonas sp. GY75]MBF0650420.1 ATP-binding protein [Dysgonomonas sp. GY75]